MLKCWIFLSIVVFCYYLVSFLRIEGGGVMKNYVSPEVELVVVNITDVITTSFVGGDEMKSDIEFEAKWLFS